MKYDADLESLRTEARYLFSDEQRRISQATFWLIMHTTHELQRLRDSIRAQHLVIEEVTR